MNRFSRLSPLLLLAAVAACGSNSPETAQPGEAATAAAPETKPGLALTGGRLVLPAVSGNPGAAYFTLANGSAKPVTIAAVDVAGAGMVMLHETKQVGGHSEMGALADPTAGPGETLAFAPGGKHVMVMDLPAGLKPGGTVELTLTFADGDKLSAPLTIESPGGQ
ncbi:copper chaperone PCu(A)C [Novosphingobium bradum]|uniref:Copper chaperone PCu(A)C n=1 Tax=Novosphingobium bradum TaxID=1737444 RepID=A0ABV7IS88_9SPHN